MPKINPQILTWTREQANLSLTDAAHLLKITEAHGKSPEERLREYELGEKEPSRTLLKTMAEKYRRPLLTFYMSSPPAKASKGQDFRTILGVADPREDLLVDSLVRDVLARQSLLRSALEVEDEAIELPFVGSVSADSGIEEVATDIKKVLKFRLADFRSQKTPRKAFGYLRKLVELSGVFVLLIGDRGSYHTEIDSGVFRGFALADSVAPFVIINTYDSPAAWSFTLIHELAHIWLGQTGISDKRAGSPLEKFCNDVASHFLLADEELQLAGFDKNMPLDEVSVKIDRFSEPRKVSRSMVAYRLYRLDKIEQNTWRRLSGIYARQWATQRTRQKELRKQEREDNPDIKGPNTNVIRKYRLGDRLPSLVNRMMETGTLSTTKAAMVLGVKPISVYKLTSLADTTLGY